MLILTREVGQCILIGSDIRIKVVALRPGKVRIGIDAPWHVTIDREEVRNVKEITDEITQRDSTEAGRVE